MRNSAAGTDTGESVMSGSMKIDRFIPFRKADVVEMCIKDARLTEAEIKEFKEFCQILEALFHFEFHTRLERLKTCYGPFNPDADTRRRLPQKICNKPWLKNRCFRSAWKSILKTLKM